MIPAIFSLAYMFIMFLSTRDVAFTIQITQLILLLFIAMDASDIKRKL